MNEKTQLRDCLFKVLIAVAFATLYSIGGSEAFGGLKYLRRYIAPLLLVGGMFWFSRDWRCWPQLPLLILGLSLGYGSDFEWLKIVKRAYCGLLLGVSSSGKNVLKKKWLLSLFQAILVTGSFVAFGVFNPLPNSRIEEFVLGFFIAFIPILSA